MSISLYCKLEPPKRFKHYKGCPCLECKNVGTDKVSPFKVCFNISIG